MTPPQPSLFKRYWPLLKWCGFALVMVLIAKRGWEIWKTAPTDAWKINAVWLVPATLCYIAGWLPSVAFWRAMLHGCGTTPSWYATARAYYIGALGKYVPGKAMVLVLRAAYVKDHGVPPGVGAITAMYETLATMGAGAAIAVALSPFATSPRLWAALPAWLQPLRDQPWLLPLLVLVGTLAALPVIARLFTIIARKLTPKTEGDSPPVGITTGLLLRGLLTVSGGWLLFALSLGCVLQALGAGEFSWQAFPGWLAASTVSTVGGFVILIAPGGLGVREMLMTEVLVSQPGVTEMQAFLAAWLLRVVWLAGELLAAAIFVRAPRTVEKPQPLSGGDTVSHGA